MSRFFVIICCMFVVGIAWTSIFELPDAPPKREITRRFGVSMVARKAKPETVSKQVAEPETDPPETISYAEESYWGRVTFTHMKHTEDYGFDCEECHHLEMPGGFNKCSSCHENLKNTFHKNCFRGCHRELKAEGERTGPIKCRECHIKEG